MPTIARSEMLFRAPASTIVQAFVQPAQLKKFSMRVRQRRAAGARQSEIDRGTQMGL
ncbi:hypothetical protein [Ramlibacter sp. WS9]|uniref:hypothetical protein n=1 Tax=Ramlibacter sp. WS9 TaxID=1882741 RepID=UPI0013052DD8|nr:hypothetical protein [Ramlibacter sp. WS9]